MLKREITYEDFDENEVTETFYFNIAKPELIELEVDVEGGFGNFLERIVKTEDQKKLIAEFKRIILLAYGQKSEDGKRFIKSDELREAFSQTAAYYSLFMELSTDDKAAAEFIMGIMPKDLAKGVEAAQKEQEAPKPPAIPSSDQ